MESPREDEEDFTGEMPVKGGSDLERLLLDSFPDEEVGVGVDKWGVGGVCKGSAPGDEPFSCMLDSL